MTIITSNARPDPMAIPTSVIQDSVNVRIAWQIPGSNFSPLLSYEVLIMTKAGTLLQSTDCLGANPASTYCDVPMINLRVGTFMLAQGDIVKAKVHARNAIGWGDFSQFNIVGAVI